MTALLVLDATTKSISVVLAAAKTTTDPTYSVHYGDATTAAFVEGSVDGVLNGTTPVTVLAAPAASTRRVVKELTIYNADTVAITAYIHLINSSGSTDRIILKETIAVGATYKLSDGAPSSGGTAGDMTTALTHAATSKTPPIDADELPLLDSVTSFSLKKLTWVNLKATIKAYTDTLYNGIVTPGTAGNTLTSTGSAWVSASPALPSLFERDTRLTGGAATSATTRRTLVVTPASSTIAVNIAGALRTIPASQSLDLDTAGNWDSATYATAANRAGKDFYLYACENGGAIAPLLILSANSTSPASGTTPRKIGGFHCLCVNVGTISGHTLTGYIVGDILPQSVWDLKWKPKNITPEGMVYSLSANIWVDIYLLNSSYTSTYATGAGALVSTNWMNFVDGAGSVGKRLLRDFEFQLIAAGSNEQTNITGSAWVTSRGGHVDTGSRRMISNIGCEDCAGLIWQWLDEQSYWYATPAEGWFTTEGSKGKIYLQSSVGDVKFFAGGSWNSGAVCGSRSRYASIYRWFANETIGSRGACE